MEAKKKPEGKADKKSTKLKSECTQKIRTEIAARRKLKRSRGWKKY